jgi:hypothetical protein
MALTPGGRAPYAPSKTVQSVIDRHRAVGLPKIDMDTLERIGVTEALRPRTLASLKLLDFYDEDGKITPEFDNLSRVPTGEFPEYLGMLLKKVYAPIIEVTGDPAAATMQSIEDAFRTFEPRGQLVRMVQLYAGLMTYAGIMDESAKRKPGPRKQSARPAPDKPRVEKSKTATTAKKNALPPEPPVVDPPSPQNEAKGHRTTVDLGAAGAVTLTVDVNPLLLTKSDRQYFYDLVDKIEDWRSSRLPARDGAPGSTGKGGVSAS